MEMLMLSMTGTLCLLIAEIVEVVCSWLAQRDAVRPPVCQRTFAGGVDSGHADGSGVGDLDLGYQSYQGSRASNGSS